MNARLHIAAAQAVAAAWWSALGAPARGWDQNTADQQAIAREMAAAAIRRAKLARMRGGRASDEDIAQAMHEAYFAGARNPPAWLLRWASLLPDYREVFLMMARAVREAGRALMAQQDQPTPEASSRSQAR